MSRRNTPQTHRSFLTRLLAVFSRLLHRRSNEASTFSDPVTPGPAPIPPWPDPPKG